MDQICVFCRHPLKPGMSFCNYCGNALSAHNGISQTDNLLNAINNEDMFSVNYMHQNISRTNAVTYSLCGLFFILVGGGLGIASLIKYGLKDVALAPFLIVPMGFLSFFLFFLEYDFYRKSYSEISELLFLRRDVFNDNYKSPLGTIIETKVLPYSVEDVYYACLQCLRNDCRKTCAGIPFHSIYLGWDHIHFRARVVINLSVCPEGTQIKLTMEPYYKKRASYNRIHCGSAALVLIGHINQVLARNR